MVGNTHKQLLAAGDEICVGDKVIVGNNSQAKITFSDGAILHVLKILRFVLMIMPMSKHHHRKVTVVFH